MADTNVEGLRVLELYSGIGGMHWALKESGIPFEVVLAVDINTTANAIYQHNFPDANLNSFGIEKLTLKKLRTLRPNAILMSPPCQPFSRVGKKGDCDDVRTKSFLHVLQLLQQMEVKPGYILVENVKGFEVSRTRQLLIDALLACCYGYQEYLLTPLQFGIPNSRLRYYMIAKLKSLTNPLVEASEIFYSLPDSSAPPSQTPQDSNSIPNSRVSISSPQTSSSDTYQCDKMTTCDNCSSEKPNDKGCSAEKNNVSSVSTQSNDLSFVNCGTKIDNVKTTASSCEEEEETSIIANAKPVEKSTTTTATTDDVLAQSAAAKSKTEVLASLSELMDAGRNMRYCEEEDAMIDENSRPLSDYMEDVDEAEADGDGDNMKRFEHLLVPDKDLRQFVVMDVVLPQLKKCTCFTKRYGHYVEGAGSLVQMSSSAQDTRAASRFKSKAVELKNKHHWGEEEFSILRRLKLRYFSPREVANLLCFPKDFGFPQSVSAIQKYRCLGNSLNVNVVARLITFLTADDFLNCKPS